MASESKRATKRRGVDPTVRVRTQTFFARLPAALASKSVESLRVTDLAALLATHRDAKLLVRDVPALHDVGVGRDALRPVWSAAAPTVRSVWLDDTKGMAEGDWEALIGASVQLRSLTLRSLTPQDARDVRRGLDANLRAPRPRRDVATGQETNLDAPLHALTLASNKSHLTAAEFMVLAGICRRHAAHFTTLVLDLDWDPDVAEEDLVLHTTDAHCVRDVQAIAPGEALRELQLPVPASDGVLDLLVASSPRLESVVLRGPIETEAWTAAGVERFMAARAKTLHTLEIDGVHAPDDADQYVTFEWNWSVEHKQWSVRETALYRTWPERLSAAQRRQCNGAVLDVRGAQWHDVRWMLHEPEQLLANLDHGRERGWSVAGELDLVVLRRAPQLRTWSLDQVQTLLTSLLPAALERLTLDLTGDLSDAVLWHRRAHRLEFIRLDSSLMRQRWLQAVASDVRVVNEIVSSASDQGLLRGGWWRTADRHIACPKLERFDSGGWSLRTEWMGRASSSVDALEAFLRDAPQLVALTFESRLMTEGALGRLARAAPAGLRELSVAIVGPIRVEDMCAWRRLHVLYLASGSDTDPPLTHETLYELVGGMPDLEHLGLSLVGNRRLGEDRGGRPWFPATHAKLRRLELRMNTAGVPGADLFATLGACHSLRELEFELAPPGPTALNQFHRASEPRVELWAREFKVPADVRYRISIWRVNPGLGSMQGAGPLRSVHPFATADFVHELCPFLALGPNANQYDDRIEAIRELVALEPAEEASATAGSSSSSSATPAPLQPAASSGPRAGEATTARPRLPAATSEAKLEEQAVVRRIAEAVRRGERVVLASDTARATFEPTSTGTVVRTTSTASTPPPPRVAEALRRFDDRRIDL